MTTVEAQILEFATEQWGVKRMEDMGLKLAEEVGEVAAALVKIPEGRATHTELDDELADVLVVMSQLAARRGQTLHSLQAAGFKKIKARAAGEIQ